MKKMYVLDTNVLLSDPDAIVAFDDNDVIIPLAVIEELDRQKCRLDEVGKNARLINRSLDTLRNSGSLFDGVKLVCGGTLQIKTVPNGVAAALPAELQSQVMKVDNLVIAFMLHLKQANVDAILVSKDINMRLKCDALGIRCQDYMKMRIAKDPAQFYTGVVVLDVERSLIDDAYKRGFVELGELDWQPFPNQIVVLRYRECDSTVASIMTRYVESAKQYKKIENLEKVFTLSPKNKEQRFAFELLLDPNVKLVSLVGPSGTGKTLLALAAGLEQLKSLGSRQLYDKMIVTRSVQPVGRDIGFLPGSLQEKMEPWLAPVKDNLEHLLRTIKSPFTRRRRQDEPVIVEPYLSIMQERGLIEVEAITYIRGRSIPNAFIVIDEVQNLSMHEIKTIITRAGDGTKIVLTGDIEQIDNVHVDLYTNGLTYAIEKFKDQQIAGHVTLLRGERSELATIASRVL